MTLHRVISSPVTVPNQDGDHVQIHAPIAPEEDPPACGIPAARPRAALGALTIQLSTSLRLPGRYDPAPRPLRIVGMCVWAALLAVIGLALAVRIVVTELTRPTPVWFQPTVICPGLLGIALTVAAFMAIHQRYLPWGLLAASSATLTVNMIVTMSH